MNNFRCSTNVGKKIVPDIEQVPNLWYSDVRFHLLDTRFNTIFTVVNNFRCSTNVGKKIVPDTEQVPDLWYSDVSYYVFIENKG